MAYKVFITEVSSRQTGVVQEEGEWEDNRFWWTEGNFGCDCNRYLEFERAGGGNPELDSAECSGGKYLIRVEVNGATVFDEKEERVGKVYTLVYYDDVKEP
jgi:hypothetical protein